MRYQATVVFHFDAGDSAEARATVDQILDGGIGIAGSATFTVATIRREGAGERRAARRQSGQAVCLGCHASGPWNFYLCDECWPRLPLETRRRLSLRDTGAGDRLFQLFSAIHRRVDLGTIEVTA